MKKGRGKKSVKVPSPLALVVKEPSEMNNAASFPFFAVIEVGDEMINPSSSSSFFLMVLSFESGVEAPRWPLTPRRPRLTR